MYMKYDQILDKSHFIFTDLMASASSAPVDTLVVGMSSRERLSVSVKTTCTICFSMSSVTSAFMASLFLFSSERKHKTMNTFRNTKSVQSWRKLPTSTRSLIHFGFVSLTRGLEAWGFWAELLFYHRPHFSGDLSFCSCNLLESLSQSGSWCRMNWRPPEQIRPGLSTNSQLPLSAFGCCSKPWIEKESSSGSYCSRADCSSCRVTEETVDFDCPHGVCWPDCPGYKQSSWVHILCPLYRLLLLVLVMLMENKSNFGWRSSQHLKFMSFSVHWISW